MIVVFGFHGESLPYRWGSSLFVSRRVSSSQVGVVLVLSRRVSSSQVGVVFVLNSESLLCRSESSSVFHGESLIRMS